MASPLLPTVDWAWRNRFFGLSTPNNLMKMKMKGENSIKRGKKIEWREKKRLNISRINIFNVFNVLMMFLLYGSLFRKEELSITPKVPIAPPGNIRPYPGISVTTISSTPPTFSIQNPHPNPSAPAVPGPYRVAMTLREGRYMKRRVSMANQGWNPSQVKRKLSQYACEYLTNRIVSDKISKTLKLKEEKV